MRTYYVDEFLMHTNICQLVRELKRCYSESINCSVVYWTADSKPRISAVLSLAKQQTVMLRQH